MRPSSDTAINRPDLGQAVTEVATRAPEMGFVGTQILVPLMVGVQSAEFPVIPKEALFSIRDDRRDARGGYNRSDWTWESGRYATRDRGLEDVVDARFLAMYRTKFDYERAISRRLYNDILRAQEKRIADKCQLVGNFPAHDVTNEWDDAANCTPLADVTAGREAMYALGIIPNTLLITYNHYLWLTKAKAVQDAVFQIFPETAKDGSINATHLKAYFKIDKLVIAGGLYNSADKGQAAALAGIWSDENALLCRTASPGDTIEEPCIGRTFVWNEGEAGDANNIIVEDYPDNGVRGQVLRVRCDVDERLLASFDDDGAELSKIYQACGYRITNLKT